MVPARLVLGIFPLWAIIVLARLGRLPCGFPEPIIEAISKVPCQIALWSCALAGGSQKGRVWHEIAERGTIRAMSRMCASALSLLNNVYGSSQRDSRRQVPPRKSKTDPGTSMFRILQIRFLGAIRPRTTRQRRIFIFTHPEPWNRSAFIIHQCAIFGPPLSPYICPPLVALLFKGSATLFTRR